MRNLPPLHALRAFEAAARHLHFGRAAEELHLDPTAISHQVRKLEELLDVTLFQRRPRPLQLTEKGAELYPEICGALDRMAAAVASVRKEEPGPLVVSMTMAFAAEWFTPRLAALRAETELDITVHADNRTVDLHGKGIDLAVRSAERPNTDAVWRPLFEDRLIAVAAPMLIEKYGPPANDTDLLAMPLIQYHWTSSRRDSLGWNQWLAQAGLKAENMLIAATFTEESHAVQAALSGLGVALLSERLIAARLQSGELFRIGENALPAPSFWAVYRNDHARSNDLTLLVERLSASWATRAKPPVASNQG
ncbi:MAG: LysR substrate-binding domain-containing protein [Tsuneonella suprasediminis]|nr:LysR family transcriptional regulator [Altererythrobacter sp. N1]